ncbi:MAG: transcription initiation factor IIB [Nitrososphaera sp.]|jgi:transcription initiation factor TFIIB
MKKAITSTPASRSDLITDPDTGEIIRRDTGEVVSNIVSTEREWRSFDASEGADRARTGVPTTLAFHDMGLSTVIGRNDVDASGNALAAATRANMSRLRMWNTRSQRRSPTERNLQQAFSMLSKLKDQLNLPDYIIEKAAYVYRKAQERGLIRGSTIGSVLSASIYIAARQSGVLRTLDDISKTANVRPKQAARSYRRVVAELDLRVPLIDEGKYIARVANSLGFDEKTKRKALELMAEARKRNALVGKDPVGMAAAILYLVNLQESSGNPRSQAEIAKASGVTEVTVRNRAKDLRRLMPAMA